MSHKINFGFSPSTSEPIDDRMVLETGNPWDDGAIEVFNVYEGLMVYAAANNKLYIFTSSTIDETNVETQSNWLDVTAHNGNALTVDGTPDYITYNSSTNTLTRGLVNVDTDVTGSDLPLSTSTGQPSLTATRVRSGAVESSDGDEFTIDFRAKRQRADIISTFGQSRLYVHNSDSADDEAIAGGFDVTVAYNAKTVGSGASAAFVIEGFDSDDDGDGVNVYFPLLDNLPANASADDKALTVNNNGQIIVADFPDQLIWNDGSNDQNISSLVEGNNITMTESSGALTIASDLPALPTGDGTTFQRVLQTTGASGSETYSWVASSGGGGSFDGVLESATPNYTSKDTSTAADNANIGNLIFQAKNDNSTDEYVDYATIQGVTPDVSDGAEDGALQISILDGGTADVVAEFNKDGIDMDGHNITGLTQTPSADGDVANKKYVDDSISTNLDDLTDVTISSVANEEVLQYDSGDSAWKNLAIEDSAIADFVNNGFIEHITYSSIRNGENANPPTYEYTYEADGDIFGANLSIGEFWRRSATYNGHTSWELVFSGGEKPEANKATYIKVERIISGSDNEIGYYTVVHAELSNGGNTNDFLVLDKDPIVGDDALNTVSDEAKFILSYGTAATVTSYAVFTDQFNGLVPHPGSTDGYLKDDGTWVDLVDLTSAQTVAGIKTFSNSPVFNGGLSVAASQTIDFNSNRLREVGTPTANSDAATKAYVDDNDGWNITDGTDTQRIDTADYDSDGEIVIPRDAFLSSYTNSDFKALHAISQNRLFLNDNDDGTISTGDVFGTEVGQTTGVLAVTVNTNVVVHIDIEAVANLAAVDQGDDGTGWIIPEANWEYAEGSAITGFPSIDSMEISPVDMHLISDASLPSNLAEVKESIVISSSGDNSEAQTLYNVDLAEKRQKEKNFVYYDAAANVGEPGFSAGSIKTTWSPVTHNDNDQNLVTIHYYDSDDRLEFQRIWLTTRTTSTSAIRAEDAGKFNIGTDDDQVPTGTVLGFTTDANSAMFAVKKFTYNSNDDVTKIEVIIPDWS